jgi:hypothetical protein
MSRIPSKSPRKSPAGSATNRLVFSGCQGTNDELFPRILALYVEPGATVADVTYGKGVFWRQVPEGAYRLLASDLSMGTDCRRLPYESGSVVCGKDARHVGNAQAFAGCGPLLSREPARGPRHDQEEGARGAS